MASVATTSFVRVGDLACQKNSFLMELTATVVSCETAKLPEGGKKNKKTVEAAGLDAVPMYELVLSDSVLFPEGGGQPCDHGRLIPLSDTAEAPADRTAEAAGGIPISNVQRRGDTCVLSSPMSLSVGTRVRQVLDWDRRLDHMQHHTAQHLLTAVVERPDMMFLPTVSWSLTHPFCFIQLDVAEYLESPESPYAQYITKEKKISNDMVAKIQAACNFAIASNSPVHCDVFDTRAAYQAEQERREAAERERSVGNAAESGNRFRSRGIPEDVSGPIRIVTVEGVDSCTCCGTHLSSLATLQVLHLLHQEVKGTTVKLYFITGQRAIKAFGEMYSRERQLMVELGGSRPEDFVDAVQRRAKEAGEGEKKQKRWVLELAAHAGEKLVRELTAAGDGGEARRSRRKVVCLRRDDVDADFFNAVRNALNEAGLQDTVLVAAWATDAAATSASVSGKDSQGQLFITSAAREALEKVAQVAKETMTGVKGGLSKMGFRGKGSLKEWGKLVEVLDKSDL